MNAPASNIKFAGTKPNIAYVIDPRFPGGTSSAVARELRAVSKLVSPTVYAISSNMFSGDTLAPPLVSAIEDLGLNVHWDPKQISADIVIIHNPSFLKFQKTLGTTILANELFVVTHENFLRPGGEDAFDVSLCLEQIDRASLALRKTLAPISPYNRTTVEHWFAKHQPLGNWSLLADDWFNICDFSFAPPTESPTDRRGRHSRAGFEKFPNLTNMDYCFPKHAESNVILGADSLIDSKDSRRHWQLIPFRGIGVDQFFELIDFMIYFTSPTWRESFGRVLAEAIAAGKVVISDEQTASAFGGAIVSANPQEVDGIVRQYVQNPKKYQNHVIKSQRQLEKFSVHAFQNFFVHSVTSECERQACY